MVFCGFFFAQTHWEDCVLSKEGISPNLEKVSKVNDWPLLKTAKEVHSFLGLASYCHRFIPQFAKWANLLNDLINPIV